MWTAIVDLPDLGLAAAAAAGVPLGRALLVDDTQQNFAEVVSTLSAACPLILSRLSERMPERLAVRLSAHLRRSGTVLLAYGGHWPGAQLGVATLLVETRPSEPSEFFTSQAQPDPKVPRAVLVNSALKLSKLPHFSLIASPRAPPGAPPPVGDMLYRHRRLIHDADRWWIGIDASAPYRRVQLCAGRVLEDGSFADVSAVLDGTVNATDREELARAVQELRKRLDTPQPPNGWAAGRYGFPTL